MGYGTSSSMTKSIHPLNSKVKITYNPKEHIYYYCDKPADPCKEHLKHKRPSNYQFLACRPTFINPFSITRGALLVTPKIDVSFMLYW